MEKRCAALAVLLLASLLLLTTAQYETDNILLPSQGKGADAGKACCDACVCTKSIPPQCRCRDTLIGGCHANCKHCYCTKSIPPQCHCGDVKSYCDPPCKVNA